MIKIIQNNSYPNMFVANFYTIDVSNSIGKLNHIMINLLIIPVWIIIYYSGLLDILMYNENTTALILLILFILEVEAIIAAILGLIIIPKLIFHKLISYQKEYFLNDRWTNL
jgi:hypothetical protein